MKYLSLFRSRLFVAIQTGLVITTLFLAILLHNALQAQERVVYKTQLRNPFCDIPTIVLSGIRSHAQARLNENGQPVIYISPEQAAGNKSYLAFLMAHECCYHMRGHLQLLARRQNRPVLTMTFENQRMELDADCCAAAALAKSGNYLAIAEAARRMGAFGPLPTGANGYPAGVIRAENINQCAKVSENSTK